MLTLLMLCFGCAFPGKIMLEACGETVVLERTKASNFVNNGYTVTYDGKSNSVEAHKYTLLEELSIQKDDTELFTCKLVNKSSKSLDFQDCPVYSVAVDSGKGALVYQNFDYMTLTKLIDCREKFRDMPFYNENDFID